jgi:hypothetical protein
MFLGVLRQQDQYIVTPKLLAYLRSVRSVNFVWFFVYCSRFWQVLFLFLLNWVATDTIPEFSDPAEQAERELLWLYHIIGSRRNQGIVFGQ